MAKETMNQRLISPFLDKKTYRGESNFDKYYFDVSEKEVFIATGQKDEEGNPLGVSKKKLIIKKIDIHDLLESQRDSVGVESYIKALAAQGDSIESFHTEVDKEKIMDFSNMPETLADVMMAGDKAKKAFAELPAELRGSHTTIEGFLGDITAEKIDNYIKSRIEALQPNKVIDEKGDK